MHERYRVPADLFVLMYILRFAFCNRPLTHATLKQNAVSIGLVCSVVAHVLTLV